MKFVNRIPFELTFDECKFLMKLARQAISFFLDTGSKITVPPNTHDKLRDRCGVFVTLNKIVDGIKELRGCIGFPMPNLSLVDATIDAAISAATRDPRFPPVSNREFVNIIMEMSVLTPPKLIAVDDPKDYLKKIEIGRDGIIIERGWFKGLLLPQVPIEHSWDVEDFLVNCCMKAGLPPDAWLIKDTKIYKFSCIVIQESSPNGSIRVIDLRKGEGYM